MLPFLFFTSSHVYIEIRPSVRTWPLSLNDAGPNARMSFVASRRVESIILGM
jgi:hypothetical protein